MDGVAEVLSATTTTPDLGLTSKKSPGWRGMQHNPGTLITQAFKGGTKGVDEDDSEFPQEINENENENEEHRDASHTHFCFPVRLYNKRGGYLCLIMDVSDPSPRLPGGYNRDFFTIQ